MIITSKPINRGRTFKDLQQNPSLSSSSPVLHYQALKLEKEMVHRMFKETSILALKKAKGVKPIPPETSFNDPVLASLFPTSNTSNCEFLIVVAMYNESSEHFSNTLNAVAENLEYFNSAGVSPSRIGCIVIVDGMRPFLQTYTKQKPFFSQFFDEERIKKRFNTTDLNFCEFENQSEHDEFAHVFSQEILLGNAKFPLKLMMCVKQFNKRKLNSHLWFFGGFCELIQPKYVMLLDVGTKPLEGSLFYLYEAMVCNKRLAGCCGEIKPMNYDLWKIVVPAQLVEYKFSHILDKALESLIGYITVLPGAFSAYQWKALQGEPLWEDYFKSICHPELMDAFQSNIYLAEDRVLCLSLVTKKKKKYVLRYVKKSVAETDVPDTISVLLAQRRRWINGSWFALVDSVRKVRSIFRSKHNPIRKCCFTLQMSYYILSVIYTWFIVGAFCLALSIALKNDVDKDGQSWVNNVLILVYVSVLIVIFITSLGVKPRRVEDFYKGLAFILGCYQIYILYLVLKFCIASITQTNSGGQESRRQVAVTIGSTFGLLAFIVLINCEVITVLKGVVHYVFLIPTYVNIFFIYSICNVHDCTWGNRPDALTAEEKERLEEFEEFRTRWTILWALCNSGFAYVINQFDNAGSDASYYFLAGVSLAGIGVIVLRVLGGFLYLFDECCKGKIRNTESCIAPADPGQKFDQKFYLESCSYIDDELNEVDQVNPERSSLSNRPEIPEVHEGHLGQEGIEGKTDSGGNGINKSGFQGDKNEENLRVVDEKNIGENEKKREKDQKKRRDEKKKRKNEDGSEKDKKKRRSSRKKKERTTDDQLEKKKSKRKEKLPPIHDEGQTIGESRFDHKDFSGFDMIGAHIEKDNL